MHLLSALHRLLVKFGDINLLALRTFGAMLKRPFEFGEIGYQIYRLGVESTSIALLTAIFTGMVLALQFGYAMTKFGATMYVGNVVSISILRELGPVLTALMVGGRIGAGMTAELGSMAVTEQIDAMRGLGADPVKKLIVPRVLASMIIMPLLTTVSDLIGIFGAMVLSKAEFNISFYFFYNKMFESLAMGDYVSGIAKSIFFGYFIAMIACFYGFNTRGGTEGVGVATTRTVVATSVNTLLADFILTKLFMVM